MASTEGKNAESTTKRTGRKRAARTGKPAGKTIKVTLIGSVINTRESHRATVRGLGLRRLNHSVDLEDTPAVRGMINAVGYLLKLED